MPTGTVKWFDAARGYGFIFDLGGREYFVHHRHIRAKGYRSLSRGDRVEFEIATGPKGLLQAVKVRNLEVPPTLGSSQVTT